MTAGPPQDTPEAVENGHEDPDGGLIRALAAAQAAFPVIPKNKTATVKSQKGDYSYRYADLADVLEVVRPVLAGQGLAITQQTRRDAGGYLLVTTLRHTAGGVLESEVELGQSPSNPQQFGGALTYLRRYELVTLLGVQADEDTDGQHVDNTPAAAAQAPAPLPAWAGQASRERLAKLGENLEPLIGLDSARELVQAIRDNLDVVPDVLVTFSGALRNRMAAAAGVAPDPEPPAPDDEADKALAAAAGAAAEEPDEEPPADVGVPLEDDPPPDEDRPAPGSIDVPELTGPEAQREAALRELGCTCENPLGPAEYANGDCPIAGHGIPF